MRRTRPIVVGFAVTVCLAVALVASSAILGSDTRGRSVAQARATAAEFFRTINQRQFRRTCRLLSSRFFKRHRIVGSAQCIRGLEAGFPGSSPIRFRISRVVVHRGGAVVHATADGIRGRLVLVREGMRFKVVDVVGG